MSELRLDIYLKENMNISRQKAKELIESGNVKINGKEVIKPAFKVDESDDIKVSDSDNVLKYVSRGGYKLEKALKEFCINIKGVCIDIGASTGGFTECMLREGADKVYAVDVGSDQLHNSLRNDKRVVSMENCDIRNADIEKADFISCDVSFISLEKIFPHIERLLKDEGMCIFLIKPQFEAGRENLNKRGIVKDIKVHRKVIRDVIEYGRNSGLFVKDITYSPIRGGDGNIEYLACAGKNNEIKTIDVESIVKEAFEKLRG